MTDKEKEELDLAKRKVNFYKARIKEANSDYHKCVKASEYLLDNFYEVEDLKPILERELAKMHNDIDLNKDFYATAKKQLMIQIEKELPKNGKCK